MRNAPVYCARVLPPRARRVVSVIILIILIVLGAHALGHGAAALMAVITTALALMVEELARAVLRRWLLTT